MAFAAAPTMVQDILPWRDLYRQEMNCQIIHDSLHFREGWTQPYRLLADGVTAGYGSIAVGGPWKGTPTVFEFYVTPPYRAHAFELFGVFLTACGAVGIETQTNDVLLTVLLHAFAHDVTSERILFEDGTTTAFAPHGAVFRRAEPEDADRLAPGRPGPDEWLVEVDGMAVAAGGVLFHYNRPYGDIYMDVAEPFRGRGLGAFLVQELKRICYENGDVPAARCNTANVASRRTLMRAGFVPCGHILVGRLKERDSAPE